MADVRPVEQLGRLTAELGAALRAGQCNLFTGAGLSNDTRDFQGRPLPTARELRRELWRLCFPHHALDGSTLPDLFHHALRYQPDAVARIVDERLRIDPASLRARHRLWFALPWRRIYTLNVDDLEHAVASRFALERPINALSALRAPRRRRPRPRRALDVVHLNGVIDDGPEGITFSTLQYGDRLARPSRWYERVADELRHHPFLIVGTQLAEAPLWQHVQRLASRRPAPGPRPRSWLVTRRLDRARQSLLRELSIEWIPMSSRDFAARVLARLPAELAGR